MTQFQDDLAYLRSQGVDTQKIKTAAYAHRRAQAIRAALAEKREVPTVKEQRGKAQPPITAFIRTKDMLGQYQMLAKDAPGGELRLGNLAHLLKVVPDPKQPYYLFLVNGIVDKASPLDPRQGSGIEKTYAYRCDKDVTKRYLKEFDKREELYDFFLYFRDTITWLKIDMIAIAYPGE